DWPSGAMKGFPGGGAADQLWRRLEAIAEAALELPQRFDGHSQAGAIRTPQNAPRRREGAEAANDGEVDLGGTGIGIPRKTPERGDEQPGRETLFAQALGG